MDPATVAIYEAQAAAYDAARPLRRADEARALAAGAVGGLPVVDLGCGAGRHTPYLGPGAVALDAARAMVALAREKAPGSVAVQADLEALPFRLRSLGGAWANMAYHHLPRERLPLALAQLHWALEVGAPFELTAASGDYAGTDLPGDDFPGRYFACWEPDALAAVVHGAGFEVASAEPAEDVAVVRARRARTLPDTVGPGMRLLVCGLNPSIYSADRGSGFARPGNRFWPAMREARLVCERTHDPLHLLVGHGIGMTDLVKRATVASAELSRDEYAEGVARVERLVAWLRPGAVVFVGLEGWRAVLDRRASAGWQGAGFGGVPAYVMPSTSGLNAHARLADLAAHLRTAAGVRARE